MSGNMQQEDAPDTGKDDENNTVAVEKTDNHGSTSGDTSVEKVNIDLYPNVTENAEQSSFIFEPIGKISEDEVPEMSVDKSEQSMSADVNIGAVDSELIGSSSISLSKSFNKKGNIEVPAKNVLENSSDISDSQPSTKNLGVPNLLLETGYKETVLDDASDIEFKLRWSDDEDDDENGAEPLSDEALKILDIELGIAQTPSSNLTSNIKEDTEKKITDMTSAQNGRSKELDDDGNLEVAIQRTSMEVDQQINVDESSETVGSICDISLLGAKEFECADDKQAGKKSNISYIEEVNQNNGETYLLNNVKDVITGDSTICFDTEPIVKSNLELASSTDRNSKSVLSMPENKQSSDKIESVPSVDNERLIEIESKMDSHETDKINEIDVNETIVDLKHLIDQDENTVKNLKVGVEQTNNVNDQMSKTIDEKTYSHNDDSELVSISSNSVKNSTDIIQSDGDKTTQPIDTDIPSSTRTTKIRKLSLDINLDENSSNKNVEIMNSTVMLYDKDIQSNDQNSKDDKINVSDVIMNKVDDGNGSLTVKESKLDQGNSQTDDDALIIVNNDEYNKAEKNSISAIDKNDIQNDTKKESPNNRKLVEKVTTKPNSSDCEKDFLPVVDAITNSDVTNDSIKINREHRVNQPDVMLHIPTQELEFDNFDDSLEMQEASNKSDKNLTMKTVTEIVNELTKEINTNDTKDVIMAEPELLSKSKNIDTEITQNINKSNIINDKDMSSIKEIFNSVDNQISEINMSSSKPEKSQKRNTLLEKDSNLIENTREPNSDIHQLSSSSLQIEVTKDIQHKDTVSRVSIITECIKETKQSEEINLQSSTSESVESKSLEMSQKLQDANPQTSASESGKTTEWGPQPMKETKQSEDINPQPSTSESVDSESLEISQKLEDANCQPSTSESVDSESLEISQKLEDANCQPSTSESVDSESLEISQKLEDANYQPSTSDKGSNLIQLTEKPADLKCILSEVAESKSTEKEQIPEGNNKPNPSTSESIELKLVDGALKLEDIDPQPSTSEGITEETQEVTDSLGLLAESSRVLDDDDDDEQEPEEDDADDGDGDEVDDFDPDDEESSNPTGDHSEESNPPHSEVDIQEDGIDIEFNNEADKIGLDSNDVTFDTLLGDSTDVTVEENETTVESASTEVVGKVIETQEETVTKSADSEEKSAAESSAKVTTPKKRRSSILAELLTKPAADMNIPLLDSAAKPLDNLKKIDTSKPVNDIGVVDLGGSSSDDDLPENKDNKQEAPSVVSKSQTDADNEIKTAVDGESEEKGETEKSKSGEVLSLDSDDDDKLGNEVSFIGAPRENNKCINYSCTSDENVPYYLADRMTIAYYGAARRRKRAVCQNCLDVVNARNEGLVAGIKDLRPLMSLRMARPTQTLLEISDSDSEGEDEPVGEEGARLLEDKLTDMINNMWSKYNLDERLKDTEDYLQAELEKMQKQSEEVDKLLRDCQKATDDLRTEFYSSFEGPRQELPGISIHDTPIASYACFEAEEEVDDLSKYPMRYPKRRSTSIVDTPAKKQALTNEDRKMTRSSGMLEGQGRPEEDRDISVVRLSAEVAPADLPPPGELVRPPIKVGAQVYAMKNQYGAWLKGKVLEVQTKTNEAHYTVCRVRFDHKSTCKMLSARSIAYTEPSEVRMTIGTRVIALFKNSENSNKRGEFYYSGVIAEIPNPVNRYRYLIFFDDGYAQYVEHRHTRLVYESKTLVWEEVHPFSRDFVCNYLMKYPERAMVRLHPGHQISVEWNGKWWDTRVIEVDAALVHIQFPDNRSEWIYRGSTRLKPLFAELLAAKRGDRARLPRSTKSNTKANVPYVEYTRSDDQAKAETPSTEWSGSSERNWDLRRQRSVAKKSTTIAQQISNAATDGVISRVVFYTPKNSVRPLKMVPHSCGPHCKRSDLISLKDLRTYNPLTKPLLSGWERQIVRHKSSRSVMYRAPCGRRLRCMSELHQYLRAIRSEMPVDLFDFNPNTHCLAEFVLNKTNVQKKDLSHGKENVPVPCVNYYDHSLPEFCSYNTVRTPTAGVPLNLDPDFLCGCDCEDDCLDKTKCACWKMTLEGARTIGMEGTDIGYHYRRLPEPLPSGIYECNSRCKCKSTCLNRVVQNPLQLKLQVFKTLNRGWGIRALNDVPKGAFICIYAGNLLTDATANLDGLNEGDEYLAELDYIEVVESMKEGYEDDIPDLDKELDKKELKKAEDESETESTESEEEESNNQDDTDGDFRPGYLGFGLAEFSKRLRRRDRKKNKEEENKEATEEKPDKKEDGEECITISDDEEVRVSQREPSRFAAQESMSDAKVVSKYRSIRSYFGKDEACYIMDAKVQGNIGRYLNHSCSPNVFVQNVFVDTHDPRFPWVSFFALHHIRAGTELTWNYNYDVGSVPGKVLYCYCGAPNCRGRLL